VKHARESLRNLIVVGDRVLIEPDDESRTHSGLFLPQGVHETDGVRQGRVVGMGPGVPLPAPHEPDDDEPWKKRNRQDRYLPMQVKLGDYALFFKKAAVEVRYEGDTFLVVPQSAILILIRDQEDDLGLPPPPSPI
jgi:co-chaperonin GroES (HSP10)